jgi:hypothetical protein
VPHTVGGTIAVAAVCNGRMGCEPHSARAGTLQQTGNLLAAKPDCFQRCVKFAPQMKKNRAIAAPACAPLGMDAFTRAQYEMGMWSAAALTFAASLRQATKTFVSLLTAIISTYWVATAKNSVSRIVRILTMAFAILMILPDTSIYHWRDPGVPKYFRRMAKTGNQDSDIYLLFHMDTLGKGCYGRRWRV